MGMLRGSLVLGLVVAVVAQGQQAPVLAKNALAAKRKAESLVPQAHISVVRVDAPEEFGQFLSHNEEGFTFYEIDDKIDITLKYEEVKKIKDGYGGYNGATQRHVDRRRGLIVTAVLIGVLAAVVAAAAASR